MKVKPLPGNIFAVLQLGERVTQGGIVLRDDNGKDEGIRPRWAQVWQVADDITDVAPGQWILCEHGRWTMRITIKDDAGEPFQFVKVDPNGILGVQDEEPSDTIFGTKTGVGDTGQARPEDFGAR
jgi:hypothetical protein